jgi:energy-coupling factor transport system permease protein
VSRPGVGTYLEGDSWVHRLDPRVKIALAVVFAIVVFSAPTFAALLGLAAMVLAAQFTARIPARALLRGVPAISLVLVFAVGLQAVRWEPTDALLVAGRIGISASGLLAGLFFASRIVLLVVGTSLVTLTTTPVELTDALEWYLRPLARLRFPSHEVAMMASIALRFIPVTADVADRVIDAQRSRGAPLDRGGPLTRMRAWGPVLIPLFVDLFRRADRLANAMEARCYRGGTGRTRLRSLSMRGVDWAALVAVPLLLISIVSVLGRYPWPR